MKTTPHLMYRILSFLLIVVSALVSVHARAADPFMAAIEQKELSVEVRTWLSQLQGVFDFPNLVVTSPGTGRLNLSGNIDLSQFKVNNTSSQTAAVSTAVQNLGGAISVFGVPSTNVPIVIAIAPAAGGVLGVELSFTASMSIPQPRELKISNEIGTAVIASGLEIRVAATQPLPKRLNTPLFFTLGGTASLYIQPTTADGWIATQSTLAVDTKGQLFVSANMVGACAVKPTSAGQSCTGEWNVLGFGLARATAGRLDLTFKANNVVRVVGAITQGYLGEARDIGINGVVIADALNASSGGIALNITGQPTLKGVLTALAPYGYAIAKVAGITDRLPNPQLPIKAGAKVIATPFALQDATSNVNITKPTFSIELQAGGSGVDVNLYAGVEADILKLLNRQLGAALPTGGASFAVVFDNARMKADISTATQNLLGKNIGAGTRKVFDVAMSGFTFDRATAAIDLRNPAAARANLRFAVFGKWVDLSATPESVAAPVSAIAAEVKRLIDLEPKPCPDGTETHGAFCYAPCQSGYYGNVVGRCSPVCPTGWGDSGSSCSRPDNNSSITYTRDGFGSENACEREAGNGNCEVQSARWVKKCISGFYSTALKIRGCFKYCPGGWKDQGWFCDKPPGYDRKHVPKD